nr:MAG TPA: hypothetical protein [Caudoviricetes sp.]
MNTNTIYHSVSFSRTKLHKCCAKALYLHNQFN